MAFPLSSALLGSVCVVASFLPIELCKAAESKKVVIRRLAERAKTLTEEGKQIEAELFFRRVLFGDSKNRTVRRKFDVIMEGRASSLVEQADQLDDPAAVADLATRALYHDRGHRGALNLFRALDYVKFGGRWYPRGEAEAQLQREDAERRDRLGISSEMKVILEYPLCIYTNSSADTRKEQPFETLIASLRTVARIFATEFRDLGLHDPKDFIAVVVYDTRAQYLKGGGRDGRSCVFDAEHRTCYLYYEGPKNYRTILGEFFYLLNAELLRSEPAEAWLLLGLSQYFSSIELKSSGTRGQLGKSHPRRLQTFRRMARRGADNMVSLTQFTEESSNDRRGDQYDARCWALAYYLMEIYPLGRILIFDMLMTGRTTCTGAKLQEDAPKAFGRVAAEYEIDLIRLQGEMVKHFLRRS